jgi:exonuclease III
MVANHGVLQSIQQAMGYIAKARAENPKEDKNLITESNKITSIESLEEKFEKFVNVIGICEKTKSIRARIIALLLLRQNVESNPGPDKSIKPNVSVRTYNCNGLGNVSKFRRLLIKLRLEVQRGGIALLQETHIVDENLIKLYWKMNFVSSCVSTNRGGVMTLFDNSYECLEKYVDDEGRMAVVVIENDIMKSIVVNVYCPNDHRVSLVFMGKVYDKIFELMDKHPDAFLIMGGDFNACMSDGDSINRLSSRHETNLTNFIKSNNDNCDLLDAYRSVESIDGYTWNRQQCYSRLDYIFVSGYLTSRINSAETDWAYEQSDHATLVVRMSINMDVVKGPGLTRLNEKILEDQLKLGLRLAGSILMAIRILILWITITRPRRLLRYRCPRAG